MSSLSDQIRNNDGMMEDLHDNWVVEQENKEIRKIADQFMSQKIAFIQSGKMLENKPITPDEKGNIWTLMKLAEFEYRLRELERIKHSPTTKQTYKRVK